MYPVLSYDKYLVELAKLWAGWARSKGPGRAMLIGSISMVLVLGFVISLISYVGAYGYVLSFLIISGYDWLKQRRQAKRYNSKLASYNHEASVQLNEQLSEQYEDKFTDIEDEDHPEEFDDLEDTLPTNDRMTIDDLAESYRDPEQTINEQLDDGSEVR